MFEDINDGITHYDVTDIKKGIEVKTKDGGIPFCAEGLSISYEDMVNLRLSALKIAKDFSISIYSNQKDQSHDLSKCSDDFLADLFKDLDIVHKIADYNLKYILGSN